MKKILSIILLLALCALPACAQSVGLFAVNVGKGDALIVCVDGCACLIDAGKPFARGKVLSAMRALGVTALDAVFLTHTDNDHAGGLEWLADSGIPVGAWYAPAYYTGVKPEKHPAVKAAEARGMAVNWLRRGDRVPLGDTGAAFEVLAPSALMQDKDDNNSLVMMLGTAEGRMLFTGDMELPEEAVLLSQGDDLSCAVLKAPNHGDDDTVSEGFARAASAKLVVISTDSYEKPGTPDPEVVARLQAAGGACWVTENADLGIRVTLAGGAAEAAYVDIDAAYDVGLSIERVDAQGDLIVLRNDGADRNLTGWYLCSDRGNELYAFPDGAAIAAGARLTVGTRSSEKGGYDLLWDDKKVVHQSKTDVITLYDAWGRAIDERSNGL